MQKARCAFLRSLPRQCTCVSPRKQDWIALQVHRQTSARLWTSLTRMHFGITTTWRREDRLHLEHFIWSEVSYITKFWGLKVITNKIERERERGGVGGGGERRIASFTGFWFWVQKCVHIQTVSHITFTPPIKKSYTSFEGTTRQWPHSRLSRICIRTDLNPHTVTSTLTQHERAHIKTP